MEMKIVNSEESPDAGEKPPLALPHTFFARKEPQTRGAGPSLQPAYADELPPGVAQLHL
jgi:hypothetical protein